jgi:hypothetical protein
LVVDNKSRLAYLSVMGRPPAEHPRSVHVGFRITEEDEFELTKVGEQMARPGEILSHNDVARLLMHEALKNRVQVRKARR